MLPSRHVMLFVGSALVAHGVAGPVAAQPNPLRSHVTAKHAHEGHPPHRDPWLDGPNASLAAWYDPPTPWQEPVSPGPSYVTSEPAWDAPPEEGVPYHTHVDGAPCDDCDAPYGHAGAMLHPAPALALFLQHAGQPGEWRHRPLSASWFTGVLWGDDLQGLDFPNGRVGQDSGFLGGVRLGWDWTEFFGGELRLGLSSLDLGTPLEGFNNDVILFDGSVLFYPTGDTRLRPYILTGVGLVNFDIATDHSRRMVGMPLGGGVKYRVGNRLVLRFEVLDNIAFPSGSGLETTHNVSLSGGLEFRLGGSRRRYWPWEPGPVGWSSMHWGQRW